MGVVRFELAASSTSQRLENPFNYGILLPEMITGVIFSFMVYVFLDSGVLESLGIQVRVQVGALIITYTIWGGSLLQV